MVPPESLTRGGGGVGVDPLDPLLYLNSIFELSYSFKQLNGPLISRYTALYDAELKIEVL